MTDSNRAGNIIKQQSDYSAFIPNPLPPDPPVRMEDELVRLLSDADRALGKLDGTSLLLPDPELFVAMYIRKEALLSSQIEGTQASFIDLFENRNDPTIANHVRDVSNYIIAMEYGLERLKDLPLSLRLIREIHSKLLFNTRGYDRNPGEFRKSQNWIGPQGCTLQDATFIPPPPQEMLKAMNDLEIYMMTEDNLTPHLIKVGLIHAQFETIHPFLDGNGRMGRLLITFWLCHKEILHRPLLYLSYYFKQHRSDYYDLLMRIRQQGSWEEWLKFFLRGIEEVARSAVDTAKDIVTLKNKHEMIIRNNLSSSSALKLLDYLYTSPLTSVNNAADVLNISYPNANSLIKRFCDIGILSQADEAQRNRNFYLREYVRLLQIGTDPIR
ncbi:MAG: Fic family protein [Peptococcaceae bacterium]|jgi:Fic family protein|nr:Fic family protein [Peptococcaceae bacterium]